MTSESFVDEYGTEVIVRKGDGHDHIQLLLRYADGSEPTSYGFTPNSFDRLAYSISSLKAKLELAESPRRQ